MKRRLLSMLGLGIGLVTALASSPAYAQPKTIPAQVVDATDLATPAGKRSIDDALADYFRALTADKLIDVESGNLTTLRAELGTAEGLLRAGAALEAAVAP